MIEARESLAAQELLEAQDSQRLIARLPGERKPLSIAEAYDLQALVETMRAMPSRGVKLGLGSAKGMRMTGEDGPLVGRIAHGRLHRSGAAISIPQGAQAVAEVEVALEIGPDGRMPVAAFLAFEIVASRLAGGAAAHGLPAFLADGAGCHAVVLGDELPLDALETERILLEANGASAGELARGDDAIDPFALFEAFHRTVVRHHITLRPGMIVMTGSQTIPLPIQATTRLMATIPGTATVRATLLRD